MIEIKKGVKFKCAGFPTVFEIHEVLEDSVQVTYEGEMVEFSNEEFEIINENDLIELK